MRGRIPPLVREEMSEQQHVVRWSGPTQGSEPAHTTFKRQEVVNLIEKDLTRRRKKPQAKVQSKDLDRIGNPGKQSQQLSNQREVTGLRENREGRAMDAQTSAEPPRRTVTADERPSDLPRSVELTRGDNLSSSAIYNGPSSDSQRDTTAQNNSKKNHRRPSSRNKDPRRPPPIPAVIYNGLNHAADGLGREDNGSNLLEQPLRVDNIEPTYNDRDHDVPLPNHTIITDNEKSADREQRREGLRSHPKPKRHFESS